MNFSIIQQKYICKSNDELLIPMEFSLAQLVILMTEHIANSFIMFFPSLRNCLTSEANLFYYMLDISNYIILCDNYSWNRNSYVMFFQ